MRRLPPLNAIRAFEAAARNRSFTAAASELCVTVTAVSHQVRHLEEQVGRKLFDRLPREVRLTPAGERLFPFVRDGFDRFAEAFLDLDGRSAAETLSVTATRGFAERWLMPRLERFSALHPKINVSVEGTAQKVDLREGGDVDVAIRYGRHGDDSLEEVVLMHDTYQAVARQIPGRNSSLSLGDLDGRPLLAYRWMMRSDDVPSWSKWLRNAGRDDEADLRISWFNDEGLAMHAMEGGLGALLCSDVLVADDIARGALTPVDGPTLDGFCFRLLHVPSRRPKRAISQFTDWIRGEAADFSAAMLQSAS